MGELQHALATELDCSDLDKDAIIDEELMLSVCAGLGVVDHQSRTFRLVHYTAQEYFETEQFDHFPNAQKDITQTCLTYLSLDSTRQFSSSDVALEAKLEDCTLLEYAAMNWGHRATIVEDNIVQDAVVEFLRDSARVAAASQSLLLPERPVPRTIAAPGCMACTLPHILA